jgi:hypothetical protein
MNPNFLMLITAACILRYLAASAKRVFASRLAELLPRKVLKEHLSALRDYPQHFPIFRWRVLPFSALQIAFNALSCSCFIAALWCFPPAALSSWDLFFMRYGSLLIVPIAFLFDLVAFGRLFWVTLSDRDELDEQP